MSELARSSPALSFFSPVTRGDKPHSQHASVLIQQIFRPEVRSFLLFVVAYWIAYKYSSLSSQLSAAPLWFPDAVLLCWLLLIPPKHWWLYSLAPLPIRLWVETPFRLPLWFLLVTFAIDSLKGFFSAYVLQRWGGSRFRLSGLRALGIFVGVAALITPALSAFAGAATRVGLGYGFGKSWHEWFLGDALAAVLITPALLYWSKEYSELKPRLTELLLLTGALTLVMGYVFQVPSSGNGPLLLYAPFPFLVWAAVRLGPTGTSTAVAIVALFSIAGAATSRGILALDASPRNLLSLQLFLVVVSLPALFLAVIIEEQRQIQGALAKNQAALRLAMESGKCVGWDRDVKSGRDSLFGNLQSMFGIPSETFDGRVEDFHRYLHPEDRGRVLEAIDQVMHTQKPYEAEFRILRPDGTVCWIAAKGKFYYSPDGEPERMLGMAVDITERRQVEEALRQSEERLRLAIQAGKMYAFDWDTVNDVIIRSEEVTQILGLIVESIGLSKQQFLVSIHPEDRGILNTSIAELTPETPDSQISFRLLRPDGAVRWLQRTGHAYFDDQGRMVRMIGVVADITERKLAEEALSAMSGRLIEAQERERRRIARELHDDINQRIALLAIELQNLGSIASDSSVQIRERTQELFEIASEISTDLQTISHELHSSKLELLGLVPAMRSFCRELSEQQAVTINFTHSDVPGTLPWEASLCLFRILQEGLRNAVKHSGTRHVQVQLQGVYGELHLTILDAGVGFHPDAAKDSRGLGLISMRERVSLVKGTISIHSKPMGGTEIRVTVPTTVGANTNQMSKSA